MKRYTLGRTDHSEYTNKLVRYISRARGKVFVEIFIPDCEEEIDSVLVDLVSIHPLVARGPVEVFFGPPDMLPPGAYDEAVCSLAAFIKNKHDKATKKTKEVGLNDTSAV